MKRSQIFSFARSSCLTLDAFFLTTAVSLLVQTNSAQTTPLHLQSSSTVLLASKPENTTQSDWLVLAGLAGFAGVVGLATLKHKQRAAERGNDDSQNNAAEEDTYFG